MCQREKEKERKSERNVLRLTLSSRSGLKSQRGDHDRPKALSKSYNKLFIFTAESWRNHQLWTRLGCPCFSERKQSTDPATKNKRSNSSPSATSPSHLCYLLATFSSSLFQVQGGFAMLVDTSLSDLFRCVDDWMGD
jgi:hypothetical protein